MARISVDLPEPLRPSITVYSPRPSLRSTCSTAACPSKATVTSFSSISAMPVPSLLMALAIPAQADQHASARVDAETVPSIEMFGELAGHLTIDVEHVAAVRTHDVEVPVAIIVAAVVLVARYAMRVLVAAGGLLVAEGFEEAVGRGYAHAHALGLHGPRQPLGREALHGVAGQEARHLPLLPGPGMRRASVQPLPQRFEVARHQGKIGLARLKFFPVTLWQECISTIPAPVCSATARATSCVDISMT